ncbi:LuxR C-terminal-related transcriptional regulator [Lysobacter olei]
MVREWMTGVEHMAAVPVMAIGGDRLWRARLERIFASRGDLSWRGVLEAGERTPLPDAVGLLLVDGDDPGTDARLRAWSTGLPRRIHFFRAPTVASLQDCVRSGASGCLEKEAPPETVLRAVRAVGAGLFAVEPALMLRSVLASWDNLHATTPPMAGAHALAQLTDRQREIVQWAAQGLSNKQIARNLGISPETVKTHLHHAFERVGVSGRVALSAAQWANGQRTERAFEDLR